MRYSLLNFIQCPVSKTDFACVVTKEREIVLGHVHLTDSDRIHPAGAMFGPAPRFQRQTPLTDFFHRNASKPAPVARNYQVAVEEGLLVSAESRRWYPIRNFVPEILPDHLRDFTRDFEFLRTLQGSLPAELFSALNDPRIFTAQSGTDSGIGYKTSEMQIAKKIENPHFFGPGYIAPYNPGATDHTAYLIRLFAFCLPLLMENGPNKLILDAGCGYSWTTEWLLKIGMEPIGVDITRTYLDIAVARTGPWLPHLVQADTENLPIRPGILDAVLCYEAFHHIPDRAQAMKGFSRVLKAGKRVVLAEPGGAHESAAVSVDAMQKYGILERGMELSDISLYIAGSGLSNPVQHRVIEVSDPQASAMKLSADMLRTYAFTNSNLYTVEKRS
jgi:SAM-dependent methyltransferase/uncharacterized protein YbaR (Trm112 family)